MCAQNSLSCLADLCIHHLLFTIEQWRHFFFKSPSVQTSAECRGEISIEAVKLQIKFAHASKINILNRICSAFIWCAPFRAIRKSNKRKMNRAKTAISPRRSIYFIDGYYYTQLDAHCQMGGGGETRVACACQIFIQLDECCCADAFPLHRHKQFCCRFIRFPSRIKASTHPVSSFVNPCASSEHSQIHFWISSPAAKSIICMWNKRKLTLVDIELQILQNFIRF